MLAVGILSRSVPQLILRFSFLCAFGCQLFDAGFSFTGFLGGKQPSFLGYRRGSAYKMSFVVARIDCQSSKTVKGTPSRSQYVMRSEGSSVNFGISIWSSSQLTMTLLGKQQIGLPCCRQI